MRPGAQVWGDVLDVVEHNPVLVLRDYHADNLMVLDGAGVGAGSACSISRTRWPAIPPTISSRCCRTRAATSRRDSRRRCSTAITRPRTSPTATRFRAHYEILGAQRNTKILGIFTRLWKRDGKPHYLPLQPRVWGYLERNLAHPALAPVRAWFDANVPAEQRAAAWAGGSA